MTPLLPLDSGDDLDSIVDDVRPFLKARVDLVLPGSPGITDPDTDEITGGTDGLTLIADRPARLRPKSSPVEVSSGQDFRLRTYWRTTIETLPGDPEIPEDAILVVRDGGSRAEMTGKRLTILGADASTESPFTFIDAKGEKG